LSGFFSLIALDHMPFKINHFGQVPPMLVKVFKS